MKNCTKCGEVKFESEFYPNRPDCKSCKISQSRAHYAPIKESVKANRQDTYKDGKKRCRLCGVYKDVSDYTIHKGHWDKLSHECRMCKAEAEKPNYKKNKSKRLAASKLWYKQNKGKKQAKAREWQINNPEKSRAIWHRYNSRKKSAKGKFTSSQWSAVKEFYCPDGRCLCCKQVCKLTVDHITPLVKGGTNYIDNIQPICQACNGGKKDRHVDYRPDKGAFSKSLLS